MEKQCQRLCFGFIGNRHFMHASLSECTDGFSTSFGIQKTACGSHSCYGIVTLMLCVFVFSELKTSKNTQTYVCMEVLLCPSVQQHTSVPLPGHSSLDTALFPTEPLSQLCPIRHYTHHPNLGEISVCPCVGAQRSVCCCGKWGSVVKGSEKALW